MTVEAIRTSDLSFTYPDGTTALTDVNFAAGNGECVAIVGPNGAGKSTFLQLLNGLLTLTKGEVLINGENVKDRRKHVGLVFQNPEDQLFELTVDDDVAYGPRNMGLGKEEIKKRVKEGLSLVHIEGYEGRLIQNLSYGQKKRVAIAGVLAMRPEILALDEPTLGLDPKTASATVQLLKKLKGDSITTVVVTHDVEAVPLFADVIYILVGGKIQLFGNPEEVFSKKEKIRQSNLRLPRIAHLFEVLKTDKLPLTIGQAKKLLEEEK
jgi:cobalt/nickel transport system ATP-binding protein